MEKKTATRWDFKDTKTLKNLYNTVPVKKLSNILNRTETAIYTRAVKLGLKRDRKNTEKYVQCFVSVKIEYYQEAKLLINNTIKQWRKKRKKLS
jgi:hypothetical protein